MAMKPKLKKLYDEYEALEDKLLAIPMDKYTSSSQLDTAGKIRSDLRILGKKIKDAGGYSMNREGGLAQAIEKVKAKEMKGGGEATKGKSVPPKFKGFSMLPESVQQNMNPDLAEKFGMGGDVKGKKSGNICRGRGIARPGTGFTIR